MLPGRALLASWAGCLRPARWPLMVLISLDGELYAVLLSPRRTDSADGHLAAMKPCKAALSLRQHPIRDEGLDPHLADPYTAAVIAQQQQHTTAAPQLA